MWVKASEERPIDRRQRRGAMQSKKGMARTRWPWSRGSSDASRSSSEEMSVSMPRTFRHEGHISSRGSQRFSSMDRQLTFDTIQKVQQVVRASGASRASGNESESEEPQRASLRISAPPSLGIAQRERQGTTQEPGVKARPTASLCRSASTTLPSSPAAFPALRRSSASFSAVSPAGFKVTSPCRSSTSSPHASSAPCSPSGARMPSAAKAERLQRWGKVGTAALVAVKLQARRSRAEEELRQVDAALQSAQHELSRRRSSLSEREEAARQMIDSLSGREEDGRPVTELAKTSGSDGWQQATDPESGAVYYFDPATNETRWELPRAVGPCGGEQAASAAVSASFREEAEEEDSAAAWTALTDSGSGETYYYNRLSGETSWDAPPHETARGGGAAGAALSPPTEPAPLVPLWKAIGLPEARVTCVASEIDEIEAAVAAGDFEKAIELRDELRLSAGRSDSVQLVSADL